MHRQRGKGKNVISGHFSFLGFDTKLFVLEEKVTLWTGFEPVREYPIGFRVQRLNHSAITATNVMASQGCVLHSQANVSDFLLWNNVDFLHFAVFFITWATVYILRYANV